MGISVTVSHLLFTIIAVLLATSAGAAFIYYTNVMNSQLTRQAIEYRTSMMRTIEIAYATIDQGTTPFSYVVYVKNTGDIAIPGIDWDKIDVYIGPHGYAELYKYDAAASPGSGTFKIVDANGDGNWDPGETATFYIYPVTDPPAVPTYEVKIYVWRGMSDVYLFPPPP